eukprot:792907-Amphidinium_carterae.1
MHEYGLTWLLAIQEISSTVPSGIHQLAHGLLVVGEATAFRKTGWLVSRYWSARLSWHGSTSCSCYIKLRASSSRSWLCHSVYLPSVAHGADTWEAALHQFFAEAHPCESNHLILAGDFQVALGPPAEHEQHILGQGFRDQARSPNADSLMALLGEWNLQVASSMTQYGIGEVLRPSHTPWLVRQELNIVPRTIDYVIVDAVLSQCQTDTWTTDLLQAGSHSDHLLVGVSLGLEEHAHAPPCKRLRRPLNSAGHWWSQEVKEQWSKIDSERWCEDPGSALQQGMAEALKVIPDACVAHRIYGSRRGDATLQQLRRSLHSTRELSERGRLRKQIWRRCAWLRKMQQKDEMATATKSRKRWRPKAIQALGWETDEGFVTGAPAFQLHIDWWTHIWARDDRMELKEKLVERYGQPDSWEGTPPSLDVDLATYLCSQWQYKKAGDHTGCTYECLKALDSEGLALISLVVSCIWASLNIPSLWRIVHVKLLSKNPRPRGPRDFRPISLLPISARLAAKAILFITRHIWARLPEQLLGFRPGISTDHLIFVASETIARAKEWKKGLVILKLDLSRAFDCVPRAAILDALHELGASPWEMFALLCTLPDSWVLHWQDFQSEVLPMTTGVPQGSSTSPAFFNAVMWLILRRIQTRCQEEDLIYTLDEFHLCYLAWADDVILFTHSLTAAARILEIAAEEFSALHFVLNLDKCQLAANTFASSDAVPDFLRERFTILGELTILGARLDLSASSSTLLLGALARGTTAWWTCQAQLRQRTTSLRLRLHLLRACVWSAAMYGLNSLLWTKANALHAARWSQSILRMLFRRRRLPRENWVEHFRRWTHHARSLAQRHGIPGLLVEALRRQHRWAGHVCRDKGILAAALRVRGFAWWRLTQQINAEVPRSQQLRHPGCFKQAHWESQWADADPLWHVGATDRLRWKHLELPWVQARLEHFGLHHQLGLAWRILPPR